MGIGGRQVGRVRCYSMVQTRTVRTKRRGHRGSIEVKQAQRTRWNVSKRTESEKRS